MNPRMILAALAGTLLGAVGTANASFLNLTLMPHPDIASGFIEVDYDGNSGLFEANGFALSITPSPGNQQNINNGLFSLTAELDGSGNVISGSVTIGGNWSGFGPTLVTGNLIDFGFSPTGGDLFEFLFEVTGGDLATSAYFGEVGAHFGVILNAVAGSAFDGTWGSSWSNTGAGSADTAPIPGPGAGILLLVAGCFARRRRR